MQTLTDAQALTPEQRRELMPICSELIEAFRKEEIKLDAVELKEGGYFFEWRRNAT